MKKFLLAICIPTYNRRQTLERLINSIVTQKGFNNDISIIINDGPSNDGTDSLVFELQKKYSNIFYKRNSLAVGMLPAILESIEMSNGEYTWLFGSDDFLYEDALILFRKILNTESPTLILSNRITFSDITECKQTVQINESRTFHGFNDFGTYLGLSSIQTFEDRHNYFTFMSVFCFRTDYFTDAYNFTIENICNRKFLEGHYFNYILILYSQLFVSEKITLIISPRLVFCQSDNHNWKHNPKITKDIKMLCDFVKKNYSLSRKTHVILNRFVFRWWFACNIVAPCKSILQKIKLYDFFSYFWRKFILKSL